MLNYIEVGQRGNPCLLLLHGLGATAESWHFQLTQLPAHGYRLIAPDLPGFGNSPPGDGRWKVVHAVKQVADLMTCIDVKEYFVAGISMGGVVALQLVHRHPERVKGLILINTFASLRPKSLSEWSYFIRRGWRSFLRKPADQARIVAERVFPLREQAVYRDLLVDSIQNADPGVYRQAMIELVRFNYIRRLPNIHAPTLVVSGEKDTTIPLNNQRELARMIPGAEHVVIPDGGHAVIADQPALLNQHVIHFLGRISSTARSTHPNL